MKRETLNMECLTYKLKSFTGLFLVVLTIGFIFFVSGFTLHAQAASLYFSPTSGSYQVGNTFNVTLLTTSAEQAMNGASGVVGFSQDKLEVVSLSKTGSVISLWVQEPSFSNGAGTINLEGIVLNPGFIGSGGEILNITFKAKAVGMANISFGSGSVLANDGQGTNILSALGNAQFELSVVQLPAAPLPPTAAATATGPAGAAAAPQVISKTHPDPNQWYSKTEAIFDWPLPSGVKAVRLSFDKNPQTTPAVVYTPPIDSKEIKDIEDGVWYFHIQFKNQQGLSQIAHFRVQVDTQPPEPFSITFVDDRETDNPQPTVLFNTTDSLSGISGYKVKIGGSDFFEIKSEEIVAHNPYQLPVQASGKHTIIVQAIDMAGNTTIAVQEFEVKPLAAPEIIEYPSQLNQGDVLVIKGKTLPNVQVTVWLQKEKDEAQSQTVQSDSVGNFTLIYSERPKNGLYQVWGEVKDSRGAKSLPSSKINLVVERPPVLKMTQAVIDYVMVFGNLLLLLSGMTLAILFVWYRITRWRKRLDKETKEASDRLARAFDALSEEVKSQIIKLDDKSGLSRREQQVIKNLQNALDISEKYINKEIEDIKKAIKG